MAMLLRRMPFPQPRFDAVKIGARMREARKQAGFEAVGDFAAKINVGKDAWYRKEQGNSPFTTEELNRACDFLNAPSLFPFLTWEEAVTVDRHLGRERPAPRPPKR